MKDIKPVLDQVLDELDKTFLDRYLKEEKEEIYKLPTSTDIKIDVDWREEANAAD
ncbi:MAG TPA: hypothetical protein PLJ57_02035 [Tepidanaerobacteraceae bacterium]|uniref:hypothetical protein n=1 Tax=Tepidanaerobacter sp. GT38 TaxID=2722793 RepID=UPI001F3F8FED|nr:hypothetical protein [Tepidanaerobacter sp. GT38]MCG1011191.1 hypothetical protein [Tepidanaerobacter sp. GT38]HQA59644.1 hypothetical protein [Tepidanaerobacteraceae bacterium]HQE05014.1 hypothetical protein [Tepidanaerobacteraceae bacterium]